jgi:hypothetical protein
MPGVWINGHGMRIQSDILLREWVQPRASFGERGSGPAFSGHVQYSPPGMVATTDRLCGSITATWLLPVADA